MTDLAIAWTLRRPELTSAIVGARSPQQIRDTSTAGDRILSSAAESAIEVALARRLERLEAIGGAARPRV
jgi:aryl-alcohol dehydrogenase-like predicted oxidoreductase